METKKKKLVRVLGCFFFLFFIEIQIFCWWKEKRSWSTRGDKAHQCSPTLACSHTTIFFNFLFLFFWAIRWCRVTVFFPFFFSCIFNSLCNFFHYKFVKESNIHSLSLTKKKQQKDDHAIQVNENRWIFGQPDLSLLLDVFSVWKPWHWVTKNKWKEEETDREREREKILPKKSGE